MIAREHVHEYWRRPWDGRNAPAGYLAPSANERSQFLVDLLARHVPTTASVLEVGCNAGRNLAHLHEAGYRRLAGLDLSEAAVGLLRETYPQLADVPVAVGAAEELLPTIASDAHDALFTMAVLEHVHPESEAIFGELARIARVVVTIEDERLHSWRHFPRNYRRIFEGLALRQIEERSCRGVRGLGKRFQARVFLR
jgi:SAM-dependent methyltransferase